MLTIIHGTDTAASRKFYTDQKTGQSGAIVLQEDEVNITHLSQVLEGGGLFEESKTIFIEQFLTKRKKSTEKEAIIAYIQKQAKTHNIILWEGKELMPSALTPFKGAVIQPFKLPQSLFAFLDAIKPNNSKQLIQLFHQTLQTTEPELIFFMLVRQFRILLCLSQNSRENISEVTRLSPWQKNKLEKQAKLFGHEELVQAYKKLFTIEKAQKTGVLSTSLITTVDFLLAEI
jgi:DNA polymerase III delta subunit